MLIFAPKGAEGDYCAGWAELLATRPPAAEGFIQANIAIASCLLGLTFVALIAFVMLMPTSTMLQTRGLHHALLSSFVLTVACIIIPLKRSFVDAQGHTTMPCVLHAFLYMTMVPAAVATSLLRIIELLHKKRFHRGALLLDPVIRTDDGSQASEEISEVTYDSENYASDDRGVTFSLIAIIKTTLAFNQYTFAFHEGQKQAEFENAIRFAASSVRWQNLAKVALVMYLFPLCITLILIAISDPYKSGKCVGCDLFGELVIGLFTSYIPLLLLRRRLVKLVENVPDPSNTLNEARVLSIVTLVCTVSGTLLLVVDPGGLDWSQQLSWEWTVVTGVSIFCFINVVSPVVSELSTHYNHFRLPCRRFDSRASESSAKPGSFSPANVTRLLPALTNAEIKNEWEKFAAEHFCGESARFVSDVLAFQKYYYERNDAWRRRVATEIFNRYVADDALLEINVSAQDKQKVASAIAKGDFSLQIFDSALKQVARLLETNSQLWPLFQRQRQAMEQEKLFSSESMTASAV